MIPTPGDCPPVRVFNAGGLEWLTRRRVKELRARGIRYEVIELEQMLGGIGS